MTKRLAIKPVGVRHVREEFLYQIELARGLAAAVRTVHTKAGSGVGLNYFQVCRATELAFMAVCAAWEDFLEASMVRYLLGAKAPSGYCPVLRCGTCASIGHAYQVLSGNPDYDPETKHLSWTSPVRVMGVARIFFAEGKPFTTAIQPSCNALTQATKIRNRVAHASQNCKAEFKKAVNTLRQRPKKTPIGRGFRVGYLLDEKVGSFFGKPVLTTGPSVFQAYLQTFDKLALAIVPN